MKELATRLFLAVFVGPLLVSKVNMPVGYLHYSVGIVVPFFLYLLVDIIDKVIVLNEIWFVSEQFCGVVVGSQLLVALFIAYRNGVLANEFFIGNEFKYIRVYQIEIDAHKFVAVERVIFGRALGSEEG